MNFAKFFIQRPVATLALTFAIIIFGWAAYRVLPVSELPNIDFATINVTASLPGADPETMASTVATPLEKKFSAISGLSSMSSNNTMGQTSITLQFNLDRNIDAAAQDVQNAISQAMRSLPSEMTTPPTLRKVNPAAAPILFIALTADNLPLTQLDEIAETQIGQRLSMISGVAQVSVLGAQQYAVRVHFNPQELAARNMDITDGINNVSNIHSHQPSGTLMTSERNYLLKSDGQLTNAAQFSKAIIAYTNGMPVRLQDVATVEDSVANNQQATWFDHKRAIVLAVQAQPGANSVQVITDIKKILPQITDNLPGGAKLNIVTDRSVFIKAALDDVKYSLLLAVLFVGIVILLFLGNLSATLIVLLALPISLIGTFGVMYLLGASIDNLSLMAMVLAVGFVVDDAIVVIENITRYLEQGYSRLEAAIKGTQEILFTVVAMTLSLSAVFLPILFMGGLIGRLFNEFAVVVGVAVLLSGIISLTLTPMLCGRVLNSSHNRKAMFPWFEHAFEYCRTAYKNSLRVVLNHRPWVLVLTGVLLIATAYLFVIVQKGFMPTEDTGIISGNTQVTIGLPYADFAQRQQAVTNIILADPNIAAVISTVGGGYGSTQTSQGQLQIRLKPLDERDLRSDQIIQELQTKLRAVPGIRVFLSNPPAIRMGGAVTKSTYQYVLQGTNWDELNTASGLLVQRLSTLPGLQDVNSDLQNNNPAVKFKILRSKAASLGVTPEQIQSTLYNAYGQTQITTIYTATDEYSVIADIAPEFSNDINSTNNIYIRSSRNKLVPLSAVTEPTANAAPVTMNHYDQLPSVIISFNLTPGTSLGNVSSQINQIAKEVLPQDIFGQFIGSAKAFHDSLNSLSILFILTIVVIYLVLAMLYESFAHPFTILTALPFATFGALLMLLIFHKQLDIFSFIGVIMLVGLVKKNGIMMIDFAIEARNKEKLDPIEAIIQACHLRFRPIMMTTMAAIMVTIPMVAGIGAGGEARQAMGITVIGGLIFSQLLTLYVTPVFYVYMESWRVSVREWWQKVVR